MQQDIQEVLISEEKLQSRIAELAAQVSADYVGKNPVFVGVLKGVVLFFSDFVKQITVPSAPLERVLRGPSSSAAWRAATGRARVPGLQRPSQRARNSDGVQEKWPQSEVSP